jgi:hypothetical protein
MIVQTSYFDSSKEDVGRFVDYLDKGYQMQDCAGNAVTEEEKTRFAHLADEYDTARMATISPEDGNELSDREHMNAAHDAMREYTKDKYSVRYMAALHRDTDHDHVQMCMVGSPDDIEMGKDDLADFKQEVLDAYNDNEISLIQERLDGRTVEDVADDQEDRVPSLQQATLPSHGQHAEQIELDKSIDMMGGDGR